MEIKAGAATGSCSKDSLCQVTSFVVTGLSLIALVRIAVFRSLIDGEPRATSLSHIKLVVRELGSSSNPCGATRCSTLLGSTTCTLLLLESFLSHGR